MELQNRLLIGKKAISYIRENPMTVIRVPDKNVMNLIIQNYSNDGHLSLDITEMNSNARLLLLKFAEEKKNLVCLSTKDIQDPILLSRFRVEKESNLMIESFNEMDVLEFMELYKMYKESIKSGDMTEYELKKIIMENCPKFIMIPKNKVLDIILGG